jgi:release factor glutamine methyltransferase
LAWIVPFLKEREVDSPRAIAEILLAEVLKVERLRLYMEPDRELASEELATLRALVARAGRHEPVQFLVGRWPFLGRDFEVAPCTLIPRPCTEGLVEHALGWYRERGAGAVRVLDLCTGSGCIAVSLALGMRAILRPDGAGCRPISAPVAGGGVEFPLEPTGAMGERSSGEAALPAREASGPVIEIVATDSVSDAVELARRNAQRLGAGVEVRCGDLWRAVAPDERFDLVVSNPPYVTDEEYAALDRNVKEYEPASALRGGADGLDFVRRIVSGAELHLRAEGLLIVEIGWKHRDPALALVTAPNWRDAAVLKDGDGIDRVLVARRHAPR